MIQWPDLIFPPINLLVLPKHEVLLEYIGKYYAEKYGDLWDQTSFDNRVKDGRLTIDVQVSDKQKGWQAIVDLGAVE